MEQRSGRRLRNKKDINNEEKKAEEMEIEEPLVISSDDEEENDAVSNTRKNGSSEIAHNSSVSNSGIIIQKIMTYPPHPSKGGISINTEDYGCLKKNEYLNDVIIDFYLKYLWLNVFTEEDRERTHIFSSFFYQQLTKKLPRNNTDNLSPAERRHALVKAWTKSVNIFEKDFIIVPINVNAHWFLGVICFPGLDGPVGMSHNTPIPNITRQKGRNKSLQKTKSELNTSDECIPAGPLQESTKDSDLPDEATTRINKANIKFEPIKQPCILIFDSLAIQSRSKVVATLREYLQAEWKARHKGKPKDFSKDVFKGACPKVPQQPNFVDCGLYLLQFVEAFFQNPIADYRFPIKSMKDWFKKGVVGRKRYNIMSLLHQLMREQEINISQLNLPLLNLNPCGEYNDGEEEEGKNNILGQLEFEAKVIEENKERNKGQTLEGRAEDGGLKEEEGMGEVVEDKGLEKEIEGLGDVDEKFEGLQEEEEVLGEVEEKDEVHKDKEKFVGLIQFKLQPQQEVAMGIPRPVEIMRSGQAEVMSNQSDVVTDRVSEISHGVKVNQLDGEQSEEEEERLDEVEEGLSELEEGLSEVEEGLSEVEEVLSEAEEGLSELEEGLSELEEGLSDMEEGLSEVEEGLSEVEEEDKGLEEEDEGLSEVEEKDKGLEDVKGLGEVEEEGKGLEEKKRLDEDKALENNKEYECLVIFQLHSPEQEGMGSTLKVMSFLPMDFLTNQPEVVAGSALKVEVIQLKDGCSVGASQMVPQQGMTSSSAPCQGFNSNSTKCPSSSTVTRPNLVPRPHRKKSCTSCLICKPCLNVVRKTTKRISLPSATTKIFGKRPRHE